jgi:hypothetical protein
MSSLELVIRVGVAYLCVRSHLFGIGRLELHGAALVGYSLVDFSSEEVGVTSVMTMMLVGNLDDNLCFTCMCAAPVSIQPCALS